MGRAGRRWTAAGGAVDGRGPPVDGRGRGGPRLPSAESVWHLFPGRFRAAGGRPRAGRSAPYFDADHPPIPPLDFFLFSVIVAFVMERLNPATRRIQELVARVPEFVDDSLSPLLEVGLEFREAERVVGLVRQAGTLSLPVEDGFFRCAQRVACELIGRVTEYRSTGAALRSLLPDHSKEDCRYMAMMFLRWWRGTFRSSHEATLATLDIMGMGTVWLFDMVKGLIEVRKGSKKGKNRDVKLRCLELLGKWSGLDRPGTGAALSLKHKSGTEMRVEVGHG